MIFFFCRNATKVMGTLIDFIKHCSHTIFMDAFLEQTHVDFVNALRPPNPLKHTKAIAVTGNRLKRKVRFCASDIWQHKLIRMARDRKPLFIATNSKKFIYAGAHVQGCVA